MTVATLEQVTTEWLTRVLRDEGLLATGEVSRAERRANTDYHAQTAFFRLTFSELNPHAPENLFVKLLGQHRGAREVRLYRRLQQLQPYPPFLAPCYAAAYDAFSGASHLLLEDLSSSHRALNSRDEVRTFTAAPPERQLEESVTALARWHALWWGLPSLPEDVAWSPEAFTRVQDFSAFTEDVKESWLRFRTQLPELPPDLHTLYAQLADALPSLWERYAAERFNHPENLTLGHGDLYFSQFLYPQSGRGQVYLIDFDNIRVHHPADDLVLLLATFWNPDSRRRFERELLRRYHDALKAAGIHSYSWQAFLRDYRFGIVHHAVYPIWGALSGEPRTFWWPRLEAISAAYRDWRCQELLG